MKNLLTERCPTGIQNRGPRLRHPVRCGSRLPGTPTSHTFLGNLYGEAQLLAFARAYQDATGFHLLHPKVELGKQQFASVHSE